MDTKEWIGSNRQIAAADGPEHEPDVFFGTNSHTCDTDFSFGAGYGHGDDDGYGFGSGTANYGCDMSSIPPRNVCDIDADAGFGDGRGTSQFNKAGLFNM